MVTILPAAFFAKVDCDVKIYKIYGKYGHDYESNFDCISCSGNAARQKAYMQEEMDFKSQLKANMPNQLV